MRVCYRYQHAAVCVHILHAMYVFGGLVEGAGAVHDMWKYNLDSRRWSKLEVGMHKVYTSTEQYEFLASDSPSFIHDVLMLTVQCYIQC